MQDPELFELLQDAGSLGALAATLSTHWLDGTATDHAGRSEGDEGAKAGAAVVPTWPSTASATSRRICGMKRTSGSDWSRQ